jgi:hypothetical protein
MALVRTNVDLPEPDVQLNFIPLLTEQNPRTFQLRKDWGITISASLCHPCSRGRALLGPNGRPVIAHQLLGDDRDLETLIDRCLFIEKVIRRSGDAPDHVRLPETSGSAARAGLSLFEAKLAGHFILLGPAAAWGLTTAPLSISDCGSGA